MKLPIKSMSEWTFEQIEEIFGIIEKIATDKYGLDVYPNQIEIITSEQMLDAYTSVGMPIMYNHWSFGKHFVNEDEMYRHGMKGLAYEIVINSNPCISYLMEENSLTMQALVMAHAAFGHNYFFKNNYLFKQWTDAEGIIDYLVFAKKFISDCEEKYGPENVEAVIDSCHALQNYGIDKYKRPQKLTKAETEERQRNRQQVIREQLNVIWSTIPKTEEEHSPDNEECFPTEPQENILYFVEKNAPNLEEWKREIIRIVRKIAQYFYPQGLTKMMNEGTATFIHYKLMHDLHEQGVLDDGCMLEFYDSHSSVVYQPSYERGGGSINPYALGWAMFKDIERISTEPTDEDREWFYGQDWVGAGNWLDTIKWAIANFKDESFIRQFLSPKVIRDFRLFACQDDEDEDDYLITAIHNKQGYKQIINTLAEQYTYSNILPDIQVVRVDKWGDRSMKLVHKMKNGVPLDPNDTTQTLKHLQHLWGYKVRLESVQADGSLAATYEVDQEGETILDVFLDD